MELIQKMSLHVVLELLVCEGKIFGKIIFTEINGINKDWKYSWKIKILQKFSKPWKYSHPKGTQGWVKKIRKKTLDY